MIISAHNVCSRLILYDIIIRIDIQDADLYHGNVYISIRNSILNHKYNIKHSINGRHWMSNHFLKTCNQSETNHHLCKCLAGSKIKKTNRTFQEMTVYRESWKTFKPFI